MGELTGCSGVTSGCGGCGPGKEGWGGRMGQKIPVEIFGTWSLTDVGEEEKDGFRRETDSGSERLSGWWLVQERSLGEGDGSRSSV